MLITQVYHLLKHLITPKIIVDLGWEYYNTTTSYYSQVLIPRSTSATSVSLNTVSYNPKTASSYAVFQLDLSISPSNDFTVTNSSEVFEFQRGFGAFVSIVITLDQKYLIAAAFTGVIAKLDITDPNNVALISTSYLLGPHISLGVNDDVVAVLVANHLYDVINQNSNYSIQIFALDTLTLVQNIPLPPVITPSSLSIANQSLVVVGIRNQVTSLFYYNLQTNNATSFDFTSYPSNITTVVLDGSGDYAYVAISYGIGTLLKVRLSDMATLFSYTTSYPITQVHFINYSICVLIDYPVNDAWRRRRCFCSHQSSFIVSFYIFL